MSETKITLKVRGWYKLVMLLIASPLIYWSIKYFEYLRNNPEFYLFLILFIPGFLFVLQMRIVLDQDGLCRSIWSFSLGKLPYEEITKIKISKYTLTARGDKGFVTFNRFMFTNFESAVDFLSSKIEKPNEIEITGNSKYVQEYFAVN